MTMAPPACACDSLMTHGTCPVHGTPRTRDALRRAKARAERAEARLEQAREALRGVVDSATEMGKFTVIGPTALERARDALAQLDKGTPDE